ncbi:MAG TPA: N-acetylneuraminate synthase family protein [Polyangiaceae bacterium]|nr:N-acetylneuraminate synthase family protein [Polyangiaceae bacterium]
MTRKLVRIGKRLVGDGEPTFVIAEIGINHNGSVELAKKLVDGAVAAGCDAVKLQKRTPELCTPKEQWYVQRDTPWGVMTYIDYRHKIEFGAREIAEFDAHCRAVQIPWFASCWDEEAVDFIERFEPPCYKAASASVTDLDLLRRMRATGRPLMISTGMSTMAEIEAAVATVRDGELLVAHATSTYPCPPEALNLRVIHTLRNRYPLYPIGYSGHEMNVAPSLAAVALGATFVERHLTLDRKMWGSDQAASLDVSGMIELVTTLRETERALGDGVKRVHETELSSMKKLRRVKEYAIAT